MKPSIAFLPILFFASLFGLLLPSFAQAQTYTYSVYLDSDESPSSGCTVTTASPSTISGMDTLLRATVSGAAPQMVTSVTRSSCAGGTFGAATSVGGPYPVGLNNGVSGSDVIELSDVLSAVAVPNIGRLRVVFVASTGAGDDVLATTAVGGGPILIGIPTSIPVFGLWGSLALMLTLVLLGVLVMRKHPGIGKAMLVVLFVGYGVSKAAHFISDGQVGDWAGVSVLATDAIGDASNGSPAIDMRVAFAAMEAGRIFFRIDVVDAQNTPPVAVPPAPLTLLEDAAATTITLSGTDANNDPLTFAIGTAPTRGTLSAITQVTTTSATVQYTPLANDNGSDSFTFTANDGIASSAPATVSITITPVNDAPSFVAANPPTINEDAGAQSIANWATFTAGPPNESAQTVQSYTVGVPSNAALFSAAPAVANNGTLTYTSALNANGTSTFTVAVVDNGGTANGGVNTSPVQTFTITVTSVNDLPVLTAGATLAYTENQVATVIDNTITVVDVDHPNLASATVTISTAYQNGADVLAFTPVAGITGAFAPATGILSLSGSATLANYQTALRSVTFVNSSEAPTTTSRTITWIGNDSVGNSLPVTSSITITDANDPPVNSIPAAQFTGVAVPLPFNNGNGNALAVADADAGTGTLNSTIVSTIGTLSATATGAAIVTGNNSASLGIAGNLTDLNATLQTLIFNSASGGTGTITLNTNDNGNTGAGGPQAAAPATFNISVDAPPTVSLNIANAATTASGPTVTFTFSENVDLAANSITVACTPSGAGISLTTAGASVGGLSFPANPANTGQPGDTCTVTAVSTLVTDSDTIDPPNELDGNNSGDAIDGDADNFVSTYTVDSAPTVTSTSPAAAAVVSTTAVFVANFSEPVDLAMGGLSLNCGGPIAVTPSGSGTATLTFTPTAPLPAGASCTATLFATLITDSDAFDPPDELPGNVVVNFSVDAAPTVTGGVPAAASTVATNQIVTFVFSENVDASANAITLNCGGPIAGAVTGTGTSTLTFTPSAALPEGSACTATAVASEIGDSDLIDPPHNLAANVTRSFSTDAAPFVAGSNPANGAVNVSISAPLLVSFSEAVNFTGTDFSLTCGTAQTFTTSGSSSNTATLTPTPAMPVNTSCTLSVIGAAISDVDAIDPPDLMAGTTNISFTTVSAAAVADAYNVTPHLTISSAGGAAEVDANDIGSSPIASYGFAPACTGTSAGSQLDAGAANGRLTINSNGSFSYEPPAGVANTTRTFCYTIAAGSSANVVFTLQNTELVWFVDGAAAPGGIGNQARPFQTVAAAAAVDTTNDTVFVEVGTYVDGITLEDGEDLIGKGSSSTLAAITGITPALGSAFPSLSGTRPSLSNTVTMHNNSQVRGLNIVSNANTGIAAATRTGLASSEVSVTTTTGRAVDLSASGGALNFTAISSNGAVNGINLSNTTGSFNVTGVSTTNGSGGSIQNCSDNAVNLNNAAGVSLSNMNINNNLGNGIFGSAIAGLNLSNVTLSNNGDNGAIDEAGINLTNLTGTSTWADVTVLNSIEDNARIINNGTNVLTQLTVTGSDFSHSAVMATTNNGLLLQADGSASITADITTTNFVNNYSNGLQVINNGSGTVDVELGNESVALSGGTHRDNFIAVNLAHNGATGRLNYDVDNITVNHVAVAPLAASGAPVNIHLGTVSGVSSLMEGHITNNSLDNNDSFNGAGIAINANGAGTMHTKVLNNTITEHANRGIDIRAGDGSNRINATVHGNAVNLAHASSLDAIYVAAGSISTDTSSICLDLNGDNVLANSNSVNSAGGHGARVRQRFAGTTFFLEDYAGGATDTAAVQAFLGTRNTGGDTYFADFAGAGFQTTPDCTEPTP